MARRSPFASEEMDGFLGKGTSFAGDLVFNNKMRIDGKFRGTIRSDNFLSIGETAEVEADVDVAVLHVTGKITGKIRATDRVEIHPPGKVIGDVRAPNLITRSGAVFRGTCFIGDEDEDSSPMQPERSFFKGAS
ncbi:MAG: polymer-forming cytoskeletal protein [Acidobacteriota bacterium]